MKFIIATIKSWNIINANTLKDKYADDHSIYIITEKERLNYEFIKDIEPDYIFFPHWSWIIPSTIYENFNCIVFHMTDLPFGRGGSPLQNLISRGIEDTKISAIKVEKGIDTGDIYTKYDLNLNGTAEEIFIRASKIIFEKMIPYILDTRLVPKKQTGEVVSFERRKPHQSELIIDLDLEEIYNHIRMLDGEGYPNAFLRFGQYKLTFTRASYKGNKIIADVEIMEEENE